MGQNLRSVAYGGIALFFKCTVNSNSKQPCSVYNAETNCNPQHLLDLPFFQFLSWKLFFNLFLRTIEILHMIEATAYCKVYQKRLYKKQKPMCRIQCWNVIEKKSPNAFDKNVQGEGKTVFLDWFCT